MGFFVTGKRGTIRGPQRCNTVDACLKLYQGMKGIGTDEAAITAVVSSHTSKQRQQIRKKYSQIYKKDLLKELDGELSFAFGSIVMALMSDPEDFTLECIHRAVVHQRRGGNIVKRLSALFKDGLSKTEYSILSLLCPRSNKELQEIKDAFKTKYNLDLEERIALGGNDLPQDLCTLLLDMLSGERQEVSSSSEVDPQLVEEDTDSLLGGGNEDAFQEIMQERSFDHLSCVFDQYAELTGKEIESFVEESDALTVESKEAYKAIILLLRNPPEFYAQRLRQAIEGAGTDDETLIRIIVLRSEVDLLDIMSVYENKFGKTLADDVAGDTSGDYKEILLKIIAAPPPGPDEKKTTARRSTTRPTKSEEEEQKKTKTKVERQQRKPKKLVEEEEEEAVTEQVVEKRQKKAVRAKAAAATARKKLSLPEQDEDGEQSDAEELEHHTPEKARTLKAIVKAKKGSGRKGVRTPTPEAEEEEEEEEEEVVEVKPVLKKAAVRKVAKAPPKEEEQTEAEEEDEIGEEEEEVEVRKLSRKGVPMKKQAAEEEKEDDEEQAVSTDVVEVDERVEAEVSPQEDNALEKRIEENQVEDENKGSGEKPEVVTEADADDVEGAENGSPATLKPVEDGKVEGSASPVISREL